MVKSVCRGAVAYGFSGRWLKHIIDETFGGKIIVEEFLHFLVVKLKTTNLDEIIVVASNTFDSVWIESLRKVLQKDINNVKSCLKVWRRGHVLYGQANMLVRKHMMCSNHVKINLFKVYRTAPLLALSSPTVEVIRSLLEASLN